MRYEHTQSAPLYLILLAGGCAMLSAAWLATPAWVQVVLAAGAATMLALTFCFRRLTVRDEGDRLAVRFGPLPLFRRTVPYADIERAEPGRTTVLDGWGIHLSPRGGWTWNLWGFDCVDVYLTRGRRLHIGTDNAGVLAAFLEKRAAERKPEYD